MFKQYHIHQNLISKRLDGPKLSKRNNWYGPWATEGGVQCQCGISSSRVCCSYTCPWTQQGKENCHDVGQFFKSKTTQLSLTDSRSTTVGCLSYGRLFPRASPSYKVTKAALNMLMIQYACELEERGFTVVGITPGVSFQPNPQLNRHKNTVRLLTNLSFPFLCSGSKLTWALNMPILT